MATQKPIESTETTKPTEAIGWLRPYIHPHRLVVWESSTGKSTEFHTCDVCSPAIVKDLSKSLHCPECGWDVCEECLTPAQLTEICALPPNLLPRKERKERYVHSMLGFRFGVRDLQDVDEKLLPPKTRCGVSLWMTGSRAFGLNPPLNPVYPLNDDEVNLFMFLDKRATLLGLAASVEDLAEEIQKAKTKFAEEEAKVKEHEKNLPMPLRGLISLPRLSRAISTLTRRSRSRSPEAAGSSSRGSSERLRSASPGRRSDS